MAIISIILLIEIITNMLLTNKEEQINFDIGVEHLRTQTYENEKVVKPKEAEKIENYELGEENNKTNYSKTMTLKSEIPDWTNAVKGNGWNYINNIITKSDGGILAVGSFSSYENYIFEGSNNGIDIDNDGVIDKVSHGGNDGLIISYDLDGNCNWFKTFGGSEDDSLNKIIQTSDGDIVVVGYTSSKSIQLDGKEILELSRNDKLSGKDAILIKLDLNGNYIWGIRMGGLADDDITAVVETSEKDIVIAGCYNSEIFNFYNYNSAEVKDSITTLENEQDGFIASYTDNGEIKWKALIKGINLWWLGVSNAQVSDVIEDAGKLLVAVNGRLVIYDLNGNNVDGDIELGDKITSLDIAVDGSIIAGVNNPPVASDRWDSIIYKIKKESDNSRTVQKIYTLSGNYGEYIADVKATQDGGIIFGGWYFSTSIEGKSEGEENKFNFAGGDDLNPKGYVIKLNKNNELEYTNTFYGSRYNNETNNENKFIGVTSVAESNRKIISGGFFATSDLSVATYDKDANEKNKDEKNLIERSGNSEGFVIAKEKAYVLKNFNLKVQKVAEEDNSIKLPGTKFSLYKLICEHEKGYHDTELINYTEELNTCWEKIGEYETNENGEIDLINLNILDEFRLVETKALEGRINLERTIKN